MRVPTVVRTWSHQNGQRTCRIVVFGTGGPAPPADINLRILSALPRMKRRTSSNICAIFDFIGHYTASSTAKGPGWCATGHTAISASGPDQTAALNVRFGSRNRREPSLAKKLSSSGSRAVVDWEGSHANERWAFKPRNALWLGRTRNPAFRAPDIEALEDSRGYGGAYRCRDQPVRSGFVCAPISPSWRHRRDACGVLLTRWKHLWKSSS